MNARLLPEVRAFRADPGPLELPVSAAGVLRYVWEHRWGSMLVEVKGGQVFVNGVLVEAAFANSQAPALWPPVAQGAA